MKQQRNANEGAKTNRKEYTPEFTKNKLNKRTKITINQVAHVKEKRIIDEVFHFGSYSKFRQHKIYIQLHLFFFNSILDRQKVNQENFNDVKT